MELKKNKTDDQIYNLFESYEISKLDINRIYRYLDKYNVENTEGFDDYEVENVEA